MIAEVAAGTLNCSAANFKTAVNGVSSGTFKLKRKYNTKHLFVEGYYT